MVRTEIAAASPFPDLYCREVGIKGFFYGKFHLRRFDTVSVYLHHVIDAAQNRIISMLIHGHIIAAFEIPFTFNINKSCSVLIVQIPAKIRQINTHQTLFGIYPFILVQQDDPGVLIRHTDGSIFICLIHGKKEGQIGKLRRTVCVHHRKTVYK